VFNQFIGAGKEMGAVVDSLFSREVKHCIEFSRLIKLFREIKLCLIQTYIELGRNICDAFPVQNDVKQGDPLLPLLKNMPSERSKN
jgi:hypothetical protein